MGIFDTYQSDQGYGGGSLIDRILSQLQLNAQQQPMRSGLPSDQAQYNGQPMAPQMANQPSPLDNASWPAGPIGAPSQANAKFTPEQTAAMPVSTRVPQQGVAQPMQQPQQSSLPQFLQSTTPGPGDNLLAGLQSFGGNLQNGLIGALVSGANGLATGQRNDPRGQQQQVLQAQYKALIPILGEQKAALAVLNPEYGKMLLQQATAGKNYSFTTLPDGTVLRQDAHAGTADPVYQGGVKPAFGIIGEQDGQKTYGWIDPGKRTTMPVSGLEPRSDTVTGPDGKPIPIPPGVDRKEFIKKVTDANAKAVTGEKTEVQAKSEKFGNQMELAERNLKGLEGEGQSYQGRALEGFPLVGNTMVTNWAQSNNYQKYKQARDRFISAMLRDESGAAIGTPEFVRLEREMFPQPGEGADIVRQKAEARRVATEAMKKSAGPGYKSPTFDDAGGAGKSDPLGIR
jgi:hypothetical protein